MGGNDMIQGRDITYAQREKIWRTVARGVRNLHQVGRTVGVSWFSVREAVLDACDELVKRLDHEQRAEYFDNLSDPHDC